MTANKKENKMLNEARDKALEIIEELTQDIAPNNKRSLSEKEHAIRSIEQFAESMEAALNQDVAREEAVIGAFEIQLNILMKWKTDEYIKLNCRKAETTGKPGRPAFATKENVLAAAKKLISENKKPSQRLVIKEIGGGSPNKVSAILRELRVECLL